jgi:hypothetical protein
MRVKEADSSELPVDPHAKFIILFLSRHLRSEAGVKGQLITFCTAAQHALRATHHKVDGRLTQRIVQECLIGVRDNPPGAKFTALFPLP